jgi:hypothetical protein
MFAETYRITVAPSPENRSGQLVTFTAPASFTEGATLRDSANRPLPIQIEVDRSARFVVPSQPAGEPAVFLLTNGSSPSLNGGVQVVEEPTPKTPETSSPLRATEGVSSLTRKTGRLRLSVEGKPVLYYQMDLDALPRPGIDPKYKRAGYLHPVLTPSGKVVSDDYPAQHIHHHGIWAPWTKTKFQGRTPDFWNMGEKTGTVEFVQLDRTWSGPVDGGFVAWHRFVDLSAPTPVTALNETWQLTVYRLPSASLPGGEPTPVRMFDLVITQTCATADPLILPTYLYGGLGFRGRGEWYGADQASFLTSSGETDRVKANATQARWCYLGGEIEGAFAGMAVLCHPDNFRAPQPLRVHPTEPYLCFAPSVLGDWSIEPGKPYVARYRFIVADGKPDQDLLDACWNGYAHGAEVKVEVVK